VIRGASCTDDLARLGLPVARHFQEARIVVLVPDDAPARMVKSPPGQHGTARFIDVDGRVGRIVAVLERVAEVSHEHVGLFLMFWLAEPSENDPNSPRRVLDALAQGDLLAVERAADAFIAAGPDPDFTALAESGGMLERDS
jgi:hypothetical protein